MPQLEKSLYSNEDPIQFKKKKKKEFLLENNDLFSDKNKNFPPPLESIIIRSSPSLKDQSQLHHQKQAVSREPANWLGKGTSYICFYWYN